MGELIRRFWVPACLAEELPEADCDPIRVRLLGEDLVAFRDTAGRVGLIQEHCPHRGASLFFGRNEEGGLRCLYHGWKMDVHGNVLDTPCEPATLRVKHAAYPVVERGDVIWTYLGPPEKEPPFPNFWWTALPASQRCVGKIDYACNYLQGMEGTTDSAHSGLLHAGFAQMHWTAEQIRQAELGFSLDLSPGYDMEDTAYGFRYASTRPDPRDLAGHKFVRVTPVLIPFHVYLQDVPHMFVPADDEHTWLYDVRTTSGGPVDPETALAERGEQVGIDVGPDHRKFRTLEKNYLQDRQAMRERREIWSYSGIPWGKPHQDMAVTESMGPIYDRQGEHLGAHDVMVVRLRLRMLAAVRRFMATGEAPADDPAIRWAVIRGETRRLPIEAPWHAVEVYASDAVPVTAE
jgi:phthalate 4,5-dioxygenase oxygenase subunit